MSVERSALGVERSAKAHSPIHELDYALLQQCIHCGMCLPTCPTYDATKVERNSPRGRIALMRAIADERLEPTRIFGEEMYFCLGCLACETACPAGVKYSQLFEAAREEAEAAGVLRNPRRNVIRSLILRGLFTRPRLLRFAGRLLWFYRACGAQNLLRLLQLSKLLPYRYRELERMTPAARSKFSAQLIEPVERPRGRITYRVGLLTGCVQDIVFSDINRDTVDVLLANGCEVHTPPVQYCCGSLHAHNGEVEVARDLARRQMDAFDLDALDAIITNAAGCGSHLKSFGSPPGRRFPNIARGHRHGPRKSATFMNGFARSASESRKPIVKDQTSRNFPSLITRHVICATGRRSQDNRGKFLKPFPASS